jgi:hypothetical protein
MKRSSIKSNKSDCVPAALSYQDFFNILYRTKHISVSAEIPDFGDNRRSEEEEQLRPCGCIGSINEQSA